MPSEDELTEMMIEDEKQKRWREYQDELQERRRVNNLLTDIGERLRKEHERRMRIPYLKSQRKHLFFDMVHQARRLRSMGWTRFDRIPYLMGMMRVFCDRYEDFAYADAWRKRACELGVFG